MESALARPYATFDGVDLYPDSITEAAAVLESVLINHPFVDGNKRTGYTLCRLLLLASSIDINASRDEKYIFVIQITEGKLGFEEIVDWLKAKVTPTSN